MVEVAEYKAKLRKLRQQLEEKSEQLNETKEDYVEQIRIKDEVIKCSSRALVENESRHKCNKGRFRSELEKKDKELKNNVPKCNFENFRTLPMCT